MFWHFRSFKADEVVESLTLFSIFLYNKLQFVLFVHFHFLYSIFFILCYSRIYYRLNFPTKSVSWIGAITFYCFVQIIHFYNSLQFFTILYNYLQFFIILYNSLQLFTMLYNSSLHCKGTKMCGFQLTKAPTEICSF